MCLSNDEGFTRPASDYEFCVKKKGPVSFVVVKPKYAVLSRSST